MMAFMSSANTDLNDSRNTFKPRREWDDVKAKITRLYIEERRTLKQVMLVMSADGFTATSISLCVTLLYTFLHALYVCRRQGNC